MEINEQVNIIEQQIETFGSYELTQIPLESADGRLLDVRFGDFNEHVALQPAAISYWQVMLKEAERDLKKAKEDAKRFKDLKWSDARSRAMATGKKTIQDIEGQFLVDHKDSIDMYNAEIESCQKNVDILTCYYDSWKQKGFTLSGHARMVMDERYTTDSISSENDDNFSDSSNNFPKKGYNNSNEESSKKNIARDLIKKKKQ